MQKKAKRNRQP